MFAHVPFDIAIGATLTLDALLLAFLSWAFRSDRFKRFHIREVMPVKVSKANYAWTVGTTGLLSMLTTVGLIYGPAQWTITTDATPWWLIGVQCLGVLVVYDFAYYFLHRLLHVKRLMPLVHGVHHRVRFPSALESLYLSPIEMFLGLALLIGVIALVGPIHWIAFGIVFFIYSTLHIVIHSGMLFPGKAFAAINHLTLKHFKHHYNKHGHNFASVTPLPDLLFGTSI